MAKIMVDIRAKRSYNSYTLNNKERKMARYKPTLSDKISQYEAPIIVVIGSVLAIAVLVYFAVKDGREWDAFAAAHECKVVAKADGTWGYGMTADGKWGQIYIPGKTTFRCNDGVDYTRSN